MNADQLRALLQHTYFDSIDRARPEDAVEAFTPDVHWQHTQVWAHHGHDSRSTDRLNGRETLHGFLAARVKQMQVIGITHHVDEVIVSGDRGAFRARVVGPDGTSKGFLGWVEIRGDLMQRYIVVPEDFTA